MIDFLSDYGLFLLKVATIAIAVIVVVSAAAAASRKATQEGLEVENLNKKYRNVEYAPQGHIEKGRSQEGRQGREEAQ